MYILGINAAYHESAACLIHNGKVVMAVEEERLNRVKHGKLSSPDNTDILPWKSIQMCLDKAGIQLSDCEHIGYSFNPTILQAGVPAWLEKYPYGHSWELNDNSYQTDEGGYKFLEGIITAKEQLTTEAGFKGKFHYLSHHDCHASSAFHVSPFEKAAVMVIDGIGEWASSTLYYGNGKNLEKFYEANYPDSLGLVWEKLSQYLGFTQYDACKVMGLAAYGNAETTMPAFSKLVTNMVDLSVDLSILRHESSDFAPLEALFGLPKRSFPLDIDSTDENLQGYLNIAAALQTMTEEVILNMLRRFDLNECTNLCMAGGVALNCAANGRISEEKMFENIYIQPAAHDAGTAMGAAYIIWNEILGNERNFVLDNAYVGPSYSDTQIEQALKDNSLAYHRTDGVTEVAQLISEGNVFGWFNGAMEWGPRALGNRSLIADPRNDKIREIMNVKVKHRELYRPFCPSVLVEKVSRWFETPENIYANRFMLTTAQTHEHQRALIPAVVHFDGSVRLQEVHMTDNPKYHQLITEFERITGVPILLNTSFNDSEPIVCSPQDAINTFLKTDIDYLAIGSFLVSKQNNQHLKTK